MVKTKPYNLPENAYRNPKFFNDRITTEELRYLVLNTPFPIFACGESYSLDYKKLVSGVYEVRLKRHKYDYEK